MPKKKNTLLKSAIWVRNFSQHAHCKFYIHFMYLESDPSVDVIPIVIDSFGGSVYALLAMRDIIKSSNKPVATIAIGTAMSAGILLLAAGTKGLRFASPNTYLLMHEIGSGVHGKVSDIKVDTVHVERLMALVLKNFSEDTGLSTDFLKQKMAKLNNADWYITPTEALKLHIIDHIGIPRFSFADKKQMILAGQPFTKTSITDLTKTIDKIIK